MYEEALQDTRWIGLYWSASGQVQRENVVTGLPGLKPLEFPLHAFELEIDGQDLRNQWELVSSTERPGSRAVTREAVVELRHTVRAVTCLKRWGVKRVKFLGLFAAPAGVRRLRREHPDVEIHIGVVDRHLNDRGYIVPGCGDAGDRQFSG